MERAFKYHGLGNDFVLLDRRESGEDIDPQGARWLCDRRRGIGGDGVLVLLPSTCAAARMAVHNADGSVAEMCGNGLRCAVKHLAERTQPRPRRLSVETGAGLLGCQIHYQGEEVSGVEVAMGPARLGLVDQPLSLKEAGRGTSVSMGNPHLVLLDTPPEQASALGPLLERDPAFPQRTNVEFCRLRGGGLELAVWERGVGLTEACGTGACAAAAAAAHLGRLPFSQWLPVDLPGGRLEVRVSPGLSQVELRGPASFVFEAIVPSGPSF